MSNETTVTPPSITRNGVSKVLTKNVFGKKSDNAGKVFFAPEVTTETWDNDLKWIGLENVVGTMNKNLRKIAGDIYIDNVDEKTGEFNSEAWAADMADFTAGVQTLSDINEELDDLQALQVSYVSDENYGVEDANNVLIPAAQELQTKISEVNKKIKPLRAKREIIKSKYAERAAEREKKIAAKKAADALKAQTAAQGQTVAE